MEHRDPLTRLLRAAALDALRQPVTRLGPPRAPLPRRRRLRRWAERNRLVLVLLAVQVLVAEVVALVLEVRALLLP